MKKVVILLCVGFIIIFSCNKEKDNNVQIGDSEIHATQDSNDIGQGCQSCGNIILLKTPVSLSELISVVASKGIEVREFTFNDGEMSGGYVLQQGETINDAVQSFNTKHANFLKEAQRIVSVNAIKEKDPIAHSGYVALKKQVSSSLTKVSSGKISIISLVVSSNSTDKAKVLGETNVLQKNNSEEVPDYSRIRSYSHELWAPYYGESKVTRQMTFQFFYFNNVSEFGSNSTYECETQVYDKNYADFDGYWSSNMPSAYYDTPFLDQIDNFTVGTSRASLLSVNTMYYTHMTMTQGSVPTATVRIKGQKGHRYPSWCYSTWCIFSDATTGSLTSFTAPINYYQTWSY